MKVVDLENQAGRLREGSKDALLAVLSSRPRVRLHACIVQPEQAPLQRVSKNAFQVISQKELRKIIYLVVPLTRENVILVLPGGRPSFVGWIDCAAQLVPADIKLETMKGQGLLSLLLVLHLLKRSDGFGAVGVRTSPFQSSQASAAAPPPSPNRQDVLRSARPARAPPAVTQRSRLFSGRVASELRATASTPSATAVPAPPAGARLDSSTGLPDVVDILGVRFERWRSSNDANTSKAGTKFVDEDKKMMLLYLPGIEGLGTSVEPQLPALSAKFDVFRLIIGAEDRSTFSTLSRAVTEFIDVAAEKRGGEQKAVILGESFGAMLGIRLGQLRPDYVQAVFAVNPATSFGRTPWRSLGPLLSLAPKSQYKAASVGVFAATIPDVWQMKSVVDVLVDPNNGLKVTERPKALAERMGGLWEMISEVSENLPPATLRWRIQNWLSAGQGRVDKGLGAMKVPVLVIAGSADRLLPSPEEAERLKGLIPGCRTMVLEGHGHAPLFDGRVDMSEIIAGDPAMECVVFPEAVGDDTPEDGDGSDDRKRLMSGVYARDWVNDFVEPDASVIEEGRKTIDFLLKSLSPVFFSTGEDGISVPGLSKVPDGDKSKSRSIVFVGNHQLLALDLGVIVERLYSERQILARGLAHPIVFMGRTTPRALDGVVDGVRKSSEEQGKASDGDKNGGRKIDSAAESEKEREAADGKEQNGMQTFFTKFGAVPVSPRNMYRLLKRGDNVLLFPGGVSEAYHKKGEDYKLFWPDKSEFVRLAVDSGAIIVPFSAIGIADSLQMVLDGDQLLELPVIGDRLKKSSAAAPSARGGTSKEQFVSPVVLPKLPSRIYVRFGEAITLDGLDKKDKEGCQEAYERVKDEVEIGIDSLLRAREQDPYLDPATRLLYERVKGEAAPTFPPAVLDAAVERTRLAMKGKRRRQKRMQSGGASVGAAGIAADGPASGATAAADKLADEVAATVKE